MYPRPDKDIAAELHNSSSRRPRTSVNLTKGGYDSGPRHSHISPESNYDGDPQEMASWDGGSKHFLLSKMDSKARNFSTVLARYDCSIFTLCPWLLGWA